MRDAAVELATMGLHVFRLRPNSKEVHARSDHHNEDVYGPRWNAPSSDPEVVRRMWTHPATGNSRSDNIGVDTSHGLVVLDVDTKDGKSGAEDWKRALNELGDAPLTYSVQTPSGGYHFYYAVDQAVGAHKVFGEGIDVRSHHGYVVGAGSVINGKTYDELPIADTIERLPVPWLARTAAPKARAASQQALVELDAPEAILAAVRLLVGLEAPSEGNRDDATFRAVCQVKDLGVSEEVCFELVAEHLNARASPPMSLSKVKQKVRSAYGGNSQNQPGIASPDHHFGDIDADMLPVAVDEPGRPTEPPKGRFVPFDASIDPADLPPRPWLAKGLLLRQDLTILVAPGAAGKSTLSMLWTLALVTGRGELIGTPDAIKEKSRVGIINFEDRKLELYRRFHAACETHDVDRHLLQESVFLYEGPPMILAGRKGNMPIRGRAVEELKAFVREHKLDCLIVDPFVATHRLSENDNGEMDMVARLYIEIAEQTNCSVCLVHHSSKPGQASSDGFATSQHSARGASAIVNAARIQLNFFPMSERDAQENGVPPKRRHHYVRLDGSKTNFSLGDGQPDWYERVSVRHASGEMVGALKRVNFENDRNREVNSVVAAVIATWTLLDYVTGAPIKAVIEAVRDDTAFAGQDDKEIQKTLRRVLKEPQSQGGYLVTLNPNIDDRKHYNWTVTISEDVDE